MTETRRRVSLRTALLILVVASVVPFGLLLHFTWWRTATGVSRDLVDTLESQITEAVRRAWWGRVAEIQGLSQTLREALAAAPDPESRERILVASATASPILSWLVHIPPEGESIALEERACFAPTGPAGSCARPRSGPTEPSRAAGPRRRR